MGRKIEQTLMKRLLVYIGIGFLWFSCSTNRYYEAFQYDNGDDYVSEGLYRIVNREGRIGYADEDGQTIIKLVLLSVTPLRMVKRKSQIQENEKRSPGRKENIGIGRAMSGIISTRMVIASSKQEPPQPYYVAAALCLNVPREFTSGEET